MKTAILALTCGRPEFTMQTWAHNFANHGAEAVSVYWYDNGSCAAELRDIVRMSEKYGFEYCHLDNENRGIAHALNHLMGAAFADGADAVVTMANDLLEPNNWIRARVDAAQSIPQTGVVAVPVSTSTRYGRKTVNGHTIEEGTVIGNWLITRAAYDRIGGFCMDYGIYGPLDIDYCERMRVAGLRFYYLSDLFATEIGRKEDNPIEYQALKMESLNRSMPVFRANQKQYREGKRIYQHA